MLVGITGASGFVGGHLVRALAERGFLIRVLVRRSSSLAELQQSPIDVHYGELHDPEALQKFVAGLDILIHAAAVTSAPSRQEILAVNVEGTRALIRACRTANPRLARFVYISSMEAAGRNLDPRYPLDESQELCPRTTYGLSKARAERVVVQSGLPYTILRPSAVYGPRDKDLRWVFEFAAQGIHLEGLFPNAITMIFVHNLIPAIIDAMAHPATQNQTYYLADHEVMSYGRIFRSIRPFYGPPKIKLGIRRSMLYAVAAVNTALSVLGGTRQIFNLDKCRMATAANWILSVKKAEHDFGYTPRYSTAPALLATAHWYRDHAGI